MMNYEATLATILEPPTKASARITLTSAILLDPGFSVIQKIHLIEEMYRVRYKTDTEPKISKVPAHMTKPYLIASLDLYSQKPEGNPLPTSLPKEEIKQVTSLKKGTACFIVSEGGTALYVECPFEQFLQELGE